jgi:hypothetical protein
MIIGYVSGFMNKFLNLLNNERYYIDTDSTIIIDILSDNLIGNDLGLMKDELNGKLILETYILGSKQYSYKYFDNNNNQRIENSTFAGVPKDSI